MIIDFFVVIVTKNLVEQVKFYKDFLKLSIIFKHDRSIGLGKNGQVYTQSVLKSGVVQAPSSRDLIAGSRCAGHGA